MAGHFGLAAAPAVPRLAIPADMFDQLDFSAGGPDSAAPVFHSAAPVFRAPPPGRLVRPACHIDPWALCLAGDNDDGSGRCVGGRGRIAWYRLGGPDPTWPKPRLPDCARSVIVPASSTH